MKATHPSNKAEFYHHTPYNLILVEQGPEGIVIRAACDNFSESRKCHFIRQLAAEGFIPDEYQWLCSGSLPATGILWVVDTSWLGATPALMRRQATPWVIGMFATACLLLVLSLGSVLLMQH